jgi:hypothetical protein
MADLDGRIASVVVARGVPAAQAIGMVEVNGKRGFTDLEQDDLERFAAIDGVDVPPGSYRIVDVDVGADLLDVTPDDALPRITAAGRSPLTIEEGIALATRHPELLGKRNCFSLLGSRCGDRRVPALWVSGDGRPRLGWCWAGNPHTWLGSASCAARIALE